jgi:hypothetical protein
MNSDLKISFSEPLGATGVFGYHNYKPLILETYKKDSNWDLKRDLDNLKKTQGISDLNKLDKVLNNYLVQGCPLAALRKIKLILMNMESSANSNIELATSLLFRLIKDNNKTELEDDIYGGSADALDMFLDYMPKLKEIVPHETQLIIDELTQQLKNSGIDSSEHKYDNTAKHADILSKFYFIQTKFDDSKLALKLDLANHFSDANFKGIDKGIQTNIKSFIETQHEYDSNITQAFSEVESIKFAQKMEEKDYSNLSPSQKIKTIQYLRALNTDR